ncbi:hypothetical protein PC116_g2204 [Phytophthora cactorum]|nr:hypothetical protein PC120_g7955 [Phytophthora cactorum]KAG4250100.1 hypothetical protein PC116_g2204 [Phytophthora cactorum]
MILGSTGYVIIQKSPFYNGSKGHQPSLPLHSCQNRRQAPKPSHDQGSYNALTGRRQSKSSRGHAGRIQDSGYQTGLTPTIRSAISSELFAGIHVAVPHGPSRSRRRLPHLEWPTDQYLLAVCYAKPADFVERTNRCWSLDLIAFVANRLNMD